MKPAYVADLAPDTSITSFFLVSEKELRATRAGKALFAPGTERPKRRHRGGRSGRAPKLRRRRLIGTTSSRFRRASRAIAINYSSPWTSCGRLCLAKSIWQTISPTQRKMLRSYTRGCSSTLPRRKSLAESSVEERDGGSRDRPAPEARPGGENHAPRVSRRSARARRQPLRPVPVGGGPVPRNSMPICC